MGIWLRIKRKIIDFASQPGKKWILALIITARSITKGIWLFIFFDGTVWVHKYSNGVVVDNNVTTVSLEDYKKITKHYWLFAYKPKPGDIIFDIGAGKGENAYCFSKFVLPHGKVIAIEAHPRTFICLKKFCDYNRLFNVTPLCLALCERKMEVVISDSASDKENSIINSADGIRVKGASLDSIVERLGIKTIDFIKMNIEGAEKLAIQGMTHCIKKTRYVAIACHDFLGIEPMRTKNKVLSFLKQNNFRIISRENARENYIRDQVYGINESLG